MPDRDTVIAMAREAGFLYFNSGHFSEHGAILRFAALVAAQEREAIAAHFDAQPHMEHFGREIADFIRARKEET